MAGPGKQPKGKRPRPKKPKQPKKPAVNHRKPVNHQKKKKGKKGLSRSMMKFGADSSGLNKSVGFTNRSVVEQYFQPRMEKVCDLVGTSAFTVAQALYLNPGNKLLFPIFSQEAAVYEQFRTNLLKFWYRSTEYTASGSNVGAGLVLLATNFDPDDPQFASKTEMENYWHGTSDAPFAPSGKGVLCHDVLSGYKKTKGGALRDSSLNNYYVNVSDNTASPPSTAAKFYDTGLFQLATAGNVNVADLIGELWVEYSFTMIHPKQLPGAPVGGVAHWSSIVATTANNLGSAVLQPGNTLSGITMTGGTITFPVSQPGNYMIIETVAGATSASVVSYSSVTGGVTQLNLLSQSAVRDAAASQSSEAGTTTYPAMIVATVSVNNLGGTWVNGTSAIVGTGTVDVWIFSLPYTVLTVDEKEQLEIDELKDSLSQLKRDLAEMRTFLLLKSDPSSSSSPSPVLVYSKKELLNLRPPIIHNSDNGTAQIESEDPEVDLSASYIQRVGEALGVKKSNSKK